jgi:LysR family transcriptional activator of nhaA
LIHLNYNHLYYFWVVANEGSIARASERLHLTPQTISGQLRVLEEAIDGKLFQKAGRGLALTETGRVVLLYADEIFRLGSELRDVLEGGVKGPSMVFNAGIAMVVPKLVAYRILEPALHLPERVRMVCHEAPLDDLLADLAVHKLDLVLTDSAVSPALNIRAYNHLLGETGVTFFGAERYARRCEQDFPKCLDGESMLLPYHGSALRPMLEQWLERHGIQPRVAAEFEDSALMKAFGEAGTGIFVAPTAIEEQVCEKYNVVAVGRTEEITERFYVISAERRIKHPAVAAVTDAARQHLLRY